MTKPMTEYERQYALLKEEIAKLKAQLEACSRRNEADADRIEKLKEEVDRRTRELELSIVVQIRLKTQVKAANHQPECTYWTWDWRYSWHQSDCTCGKVEVSDED